MKREVAFFKDRRSTSGKALLAAMRAVGMSDAEIVEALKAAQQARVTDVASCPSCGHNLNQDGSYCTFCGHQPQHG